MFSRNNLLRLPALLAIGLFAFSQTSLAEETIASPPNDASDETEMTKRALEQKGGSADQIPHDELARAAEIAKSVTANGERRADEESLTIAQVSTTPAPESTSPG